jgi:hypothetical protein
MENRRAGQDQGSVRDLFANPQRYRQNIIRCFRDQTARWSGPLYVVVFPTRFCPVGCAHCYFASPKPGDIPAGGDTILGQAQVRAVARFVRGGPTEMLQITGGGEPLLELESTLELIRTATSQRLDLNTSGVTLVSPRKAEEVIGQLFTAHRASRCGAPFNFRLSFDEFHREKMGTRAITNVISVFRKRHTQYRDAGFNLRLHSLLDGDTAVPDLLSSMAPDMAQVEHGHPYGVPYSVPTRVWFSDGSGFDITYAGQMYADLRPNLHDVEKTEKNVKRFDLLRMRNPGLFVGSSGSPGLCLVIHEDGVVELWNTTPKDTLCNIRTHGVDEVRRSVLTDPIQVATLEKTNLYINDLIDEVNPLANRRAKATGSATLFNKLALGEARDRLYVSLRILQDYLAEGLEDRVDMENLAPDVKAALRLSPAELQRLYAESGFDIVAETLADPAVTAQGLRDLLDCVERGLYAVKKEEVMGRIRGAPHLPDAVKSALC